MTVSYEAVLFDFGGVFIDSPFAVAAAAASRIGAPLDVLSDVMFGSYDVDGDHPWHRLERGEITFEEARAAIADLAEGAGLGALDPVDVLAELSATGHGARGFVVDLVREVRAEGIRTGIVTNNVAEFASFWRPILPLEELFDDVVDSSAVGLRKPDPTIFSLACERLGVDPSRTVFVDDYDGNVRGARAAGLTAFCCGYTVESTQATVDALRQLLVSG